MMQRLILALLLWIAFGPAAAASLAVVDAQIAAHPGETGTYILDTGEEALLARAWLTDHAEHSIEVQYFIWSTDNIGILAAEALLRARYERERDPVVRDAIAAAVSLRPAEQRDSAGVGPSSRRPKDRE